MKDEITKEFARSDTIRIDGVVNKADDKIKFTGYVFGGDGLWMRQTEVLEVALNRGQIAVTRRPRVLRDNAADLFDAVKRFLDGQGTEREFDNAVDNLRAVIARIES